jgi:DNA-binding NtrC family response regulator
LEFVCAILSARGYTVLRAPSGMAALEQSRGHEEEIALLLTDVVMPDLNGPHLAERLLTRIPSLRVLFMSGWELNVITHEGAFRRGYQTISKPFSAADLLLAVETALVEPATQEGHA